MSSPGSIRSPWAHPRSRGENDEFAGVDPFAVGSSPLARGKPGLDLDRADASRLIPARAGKTTQHVRSGIRPRAHPRSRGENPYVSGTDGSFPGSSPLARGKQGRRRRGGERAGLIPARAGKTSVEPEHRPQTPAHPRSRGENVRLGTLQGFAPGSSPLARGKHRDHGRDPHPLRLIPARAGKTPGGREEAGVVVGSSPLARGKRCKGGGV